MSGKRRQLRGFDLKQIHGHESLIGVDEVGRGALAGPVVAAAVWVTRDFLEGRWAISRTRLVNDSKQVPAPVRLRLAGEMERLAGAGHIRYALGVAGVAEIETRNIFGATKLAMRRALEGIYPAGAFRREGEVDLFSCQAKAPDPAPVSCRVLIDGRPLKIFPYPHTGLIDGDARSLCVAMASIVAKVARDRLMEQLDGEFPEYGFGRHKGYGTPEHRELLLRKGSCPHHRELFLRKLYAGAALDLEGQQEFSIVDET